jgi:hypothetical protein
MANCLRLGDRVEVAPYWWSEPKPDTTFEGTVLAFEQVLGSQQVRVAPVDPAPLQDDDELYHFRALKPVRGAA